MVNLLLKPHMPVDPKLLTSKVCKEYFFFYTDKSKQLEEQPVSPYQIQSL